VSVKLLVVIFGWTQLATVEIDICKHDSMQT